MSNLLPKIAIGATAALGLTLLAGFSMGDNAHCHRGLSADQARSVVTYKVEDTLDDLEATEVQREQILEIKDELLDEGLALRETKGETRDYLKAQWASTTPDREGIHDLIDARADEMRGFAHQVADALIEVHGILEPEQRQALSERAEARAGGR